LLAQEDRVAVDARFVEDRLHVDLSVAALADRVVRSRLESGLPQVLELEVDVFDASGVRLGRLVRTDRVIFDLWEERFRIEELMGGAQRSLTVETLDEVMAITLSADDLAVLSTSAVREHRGEPIHLRFGAQLNPPTPESIHRIRRWLARPGGAAAEGDTFFGSFVGLFVNRSVTSADAAVHYRSRDILVPAGAP
jgi:hypothetical protein